MQNLRCNIKQSCIFHLILLGISSSLILSVKNRGNFFFFFETSGNSIFTKTILDRFGAPLSYLFSSIFSNFFFHLVWSNYYLFLAKIPSCCGNDVLISGGRKEGLIRYLMGGGRIHKIPFFRTNIMFESFQIVQQSTSQE